MKAFNWYYIHLRNTRSNRANPRNGRVEININGFSLVDTDKAQNMKVILSDEEMLKLSRELEQMVAYKQTDDYKKFGW